jgi:hypothetical protein
VLLYCRRKAFPKTWMLMMPIIRRLSSRLG